MSNNKLIEDINPILNPFTGEKAEGFEAGIEALAQALFGKKSKGKGKKPQPADPRLKKLPIPQESEEDDENQDEPQENNDTDENNNQDDNKEGESKELPQADGDLKEKELNDLIDKITAARDKANDAIDDAGNVVNKNAAKDQVDDLAKEAERLAQEANDGEGKEAEKAQSDANKIAARLKSIADFWEGEKGEEHLDDLKADARERKAYQSVAKELRKMKLANLKRNYSYTPLSIDEIVHNIIHTIKTQIQPQRDSSWSRYNPKSDDLGYVAPGRYMNNKKKKPKVVFFFDVSGSWCGDKVKIDMGHRIEEALKVLHDKGKIDLTCLYFGSKVHSTFTMNDQSNSDAPIPDAIEMVKNGDLDNIIIMTDDNPHSDEKLEVPGYAWLLFYDTVSESLATNVKGKKGTKIVMIEHN